MTNVTDQPPVGPPPTTPPRLLRRSSTDRVAAGVCGGLGEYFGVDPVLFRVLFATTAFLGIGILAYLIAWAAMPEQGVATSGADRFAGEMQRRHVPVWVVVVAAVVVGWVVLFSWWSPWPFFPVAIAAIILIIALNRRSGVTPPDQPPYPASPYPASPYPASSYPASQYPVPGPAQPAVPYDLGDAPTAEYRPVGSEFGDWVRGSTSAWRERRKRNRPMRIAAWSALAVALLVLAIVDAVTGIRIPVYFWTVLAIVAVALIVGAVIRRPVWGLSVLLFPAIFGLVALGGTHMSLHDGSGDRLYVPRSAGDLRDQYRMAFGRSIFDLRELPSGDGRTVRIDQAAGQVKIIVARSADVRVHAALRAGAIQLDGTDVHSGLSFDRDVVIGSTAANQLTFDVRLEAGAVDIEYAP